MLFENPFTVAAKKDLLWLCINSNTCYRKIYGRMVGVDKEMLYSSILKRKIIPNKLSRNNNNFISLTWVKNCSLSQKANGKFCEPSRNGILIFLFLFELSKKTDWIFIPCCSSSWCYLTFRNKAKYWGSVSHHLFSLSQLLFHYVCACFFIPWLFPS